MFYNMPTRPNGWYGWRPDRPDHRDVLAARLTAPIAPAALPPHVDLRIWFPDCYDQGNLGSCTANAIAAALEYDQKKQGLPQFTPSRLFIYYNERAMEGTIASDAGAEIRDGIKSVNHLGAPPEDEWKYLEKKFKQKPSLKAFRHGKKHRAVEYARVTQSVAEIRKCLAAQFPVVFGFTCYEAFEGDEVARTGILNLPARGENVVGGHAVVCVGYDMPTNRIIVRNSWNTDWGMAGYFTMPFDYICNPNLADDLWVLRQTE